MYVDGLGLHQPNDIVINSNGIILYRDAMITEWEINPPM